MKTTLIFPSYLHLAGFISVTVNGNIEIDLQNKSLTAAFSEKEVELAVQSFDAEVMLATS